MSLPFLFAWAAFLIASAKVFLLVLEIVLKRYGTSGKLFLLTHRIITGVAPRSHHFVFHDLSDTVRVTQNKNVGQWSILWHNSDATVTKQWHNSHFGQRLFDRFREETSISAAFKCVNRGMENTLCKYKPLIRILSTTDTRSTAWTEKNKRS